MSCRFWGLKVSLTDMRVGLGSEQKFKALSFVVLTAVMQSSVSLHSLNIQIITERDDKMKGSYDEDHVHADKQRAFIITMTDQL